MIGENNFYRVVCNYVQFRQSLNEDFKTLIFIPNDEFRELAWGKVLADFFRDHIGIVMSETVSCKSEEVRQLTTSQLMCDLIKFAAAWAHFRWRTTFPVVFRQEISAWQILSKYVKNPLSFYPAQPPMNTYLKFPWRILRYHSFPGVGDWKIIFDENCGHATIVYF